MRIRHLLLTRTSRVENRARRKNEARPIGKRQS